MSFGPGIDITVTVDPMGFCYGEGVFGPEPEYRPLAAIRESLLDRNCSGPDPVYAIAMDVGKEKDRRELERRMLLYGVVTYASGRLGSEPVRSQGHVHRMSSHSGWSPPEVYEVWSGRAFVYMQEFAADSPGRCFAVEAGPGDVVVVPPGWAHSTISADPNQPLTFGAWCDREYGFLYDEVRGRGGLAWYPILTEEGIEWRPNPRYHVSPLVVKRPQGYTNLQLTRGVPIYSMFERDPKAIQWVSQPHLVQHSWQEFEP